MKIRDMTFADILKELLYVENDQARRCLKRGQISRTATKRQKSLLRELERRDYPLREVQYDFILEL